MDNIGDASDRSIDDNGDHHDNQRNHEDCYPSSREEREEIVEETRTTGRDQATDQTGRKGQVGSDRNPVMYMSDIVILVNIKQSIIFSFLDANS